MARQKIKYSQLLMFIAVMNIYIKRLGKKRTSVSIAFEEIKPSIISAHGKYLKVLEAARQKFAATEGEEKFLIINEGLKGEDRFTYTDESRTKMIEEVESIQDKLVEIDSFIVGQIPKTLTPDEVRAFRGILIPEKHKWEIPEFDKNGDEIAPIEPPPIVSAKK